MIDLRSDTVTKPDTAMRNAARDADVGDDVYAEDPTVNELEARAADLAGFDDALFVPTGTMGNQVAIRTHTDRGQEILVERESHVFTAELGGCAQLSGLQIRTLDGGDRGILTPEQVRESYVEENLHQPGTGLLTIENTHSTKGGVAIAPEKVNAAAAAAHDLGVPVHLDGSRVFNAAVAHDVSPERMTESVDSVMFCLSKGLGAPVGSILAGSEEFVARARRNRKLFGGGMRQAGLIAAPGLLSLDNVGRLAEDHENARELAERLAGVKEIDVQDPETNIVLVDTKGMDLTADEFLDACEDAGVLGTQLDTYIARFCTHWDVNGDDVAEAAERVREAVES